MTVVRVAARPPSGRSDQLPVEVHAQRGARVVKPEEIRAPQGIHQHMWPCAAQQPVAESAFQTLSTVAGQITCVGETTHVAHPSKRRRCGCYLRGTVLEACGLRWGRSADTRATASSRRACAVTWLPPALHMPVPPSGPSSAEDATSDSPGLIGSGTSTLTSCRKR